MKTKTMGMQAPLETYGVVLDAGGRPSFFRSRRPLRELEVTMSISDSFDALGVAHDRGRRLRVEAATERLRGTSGTRSALAMFLRRAAERLDPAPLARRPVSRPELSVKGR